MQHDTQTFKNGRATKEHLKNEMYLVTAPENNLSIIRWDKAVKESRKITSQPSPFFIENALTW